MDALSLLVSWSMYYYTCFGLLSWIRGGVLSQRAQTEAKQPETRPYLVQDASLLIFPTEAHAQ